MTAHGTNALAAELRRRGLAAPARLLLEAHRPLRPLLGDVATFLTPVLRPIFGRQALELGEALGDDAGLDELLEQLAKTDER
jgi:hypothetical protein